MTTLHAACSCGVSFEADADNEDFVPVVRAHVDRCGRELEWWLTVPAWTPLPFLGFRIANTLGFSSGANRVPMPAPNPRKQR